MRKNLFVMSIVSAVAAISLAAGASLALFSAKASSGPENFTAGTLSISVDDPGTWSVNFDKMAPGDTVTKTLTLKNTGTLDLGFGTQMTRTGALFTGATPAIANLINGTTADLTHPLAPGATQQVQVEVTLPLAAPNSYQEATGTLDLTFVAFQTRNLVEADSTFTKTGFFAPWDIYKLVDANGQQVMLESPDMIAFTEIWPNGVVRSYPATPGDPLYYFNTAPTRPHGLYQYRIVMNDGNVYQPTISY